MAAKYRIDSIRSNAFSPLNLPPRADECEIGVYLKKFDQNKFHNRVSVQDHRPMVGPGIDY